jgi:hypothetical protein
MPAKPRGERPGAWWISEHYDLLQVASPGSIVSYGTAIHVAVALWRLAQLHRREIERLREERAEARAALVASERKREHLDTALDLAANKLDEARAERDVALAKVAAVIVGLSQMVDIDWRTVVKCPRHDDRPCGKCVMTAHCIAAWVEAVTDVARPAARTCATCRHRDGSTADDCHACDACVAGSGWEGRE